MVIGAVGVLLPLFVFMTVVNINRQKQSSVRLLKEKGAALIRAFEAGTRTGMMGGGSFQLQRLLIETAQQPDIAYLFVVDTRSRIVAHSDADLIGRELGTDLDLQAIAKQEEPRWRIIETSGGAVFEVFRRFLPDGPDRGMMHRMMMHRGRFDPEHPLDPGGPRPNLREQMAIFIGLDMTAVEEARRADARHTVLMAVVLLLIGFAGVVLLFMAQSYRGARASLSRVQAFSDHLVHHMPTALVAVDDRGKIASFNRVAESILALPADQALGKPAKEILPGPLLAEIDPESGSGSPGIREIECRMADDRLVPLEVNLSRIRSEDGDRFDSVVLFRDQSEIRALRRDLARNQRLASVGRLAAGVAHEVRNPLSSIKGFATYFKERYRQVAEDLHIAELMIGEVERVDRVIGQLLDFARPVRIQPSIVAISGLLADSLMLIESRTQEQGIRTRMRVDERIESGVMDEDRVRQVLLNLYLNAVDAMGSGGELTVSAEPTHEGGIEIRVADTGAGIAEADLAHVFDPYFTTKSSGTGLGLAIVNNIMEAHGGKIRIDSRPGTGTVVILSFPDQIRKMEDPSSPSASPRQAEQ
jgi:two-component system sensor histidine kinase HydH